MALFEFEGKSEKTGKNASNQNWKTTLAREKKALHSFNYIVVPFQKEKFTELERELQREKVQSVLIVEEFRLFPNEQDQN